MLPRVGLLLLVFGWSHATLATPDCGNFRIWPRGSQPANFEAFLRALDEDLEAVLAQSPSAQLRAAQSTEASPPPVEDTPTTTTGYLRAFTRVLLSRLLKEVDSIRHIPGRNDRRARAYNAWAEVRMAQAILVVYMRTLRYDRDFRNNIQLEHEKAFIALAEQATWVRSLQTQLDEAKLAFSEKKTLPSTHPLHTVTPEELASRISWSSQLLMESIAKLRSVDVRVATTRYPEVLHRVRATQEVYDVILRDLWGILKKITWPSSRWAFHTMIDIQVLQLMYANAHYLTKIVIPAIIGLSTTMAIFGDWLHLKTVLEALQRLLGSP